VAWRLSFPLPSPTAPHGSEVDAQQFAQSAAVIVRKVRAVFQQQPARLSEQCGSTCRTKSSHLVASDPVDGFVEKLRDVKTVEDVNGRRAAGPHDTEEGHRFRGRADAKYSLNVIVTYPSSSAR
jgi:hypothetical protein